MVRITWLFTIWLLVISSLAVMTGHGQAISTTFGTRTAVVVTFNLFENKLKLSSNVDFANVLITFDDIPDQYVTVKQLRDWVKAQPKLPLKVVGQQ